MTLTLTAANSYTTGPPKVLLTGLSTTTGTPPIPVNTLIDVWRVHADGSRHRVLTEQGPRLVGGGWAWLDIHPPYNQPIHYEIIAAGFTAVSNTTWVICDTVWLVHPSRAELSVPVDGVLKIGDRTANSRSEKFTPIGGKLVFLTEGFRDGVKGSMLLRVLDEAPFKALFADDSVILINTPGTTGWDLGWIWVQPGDVEFSNPADLVPYVYRHLSIPFEESTDPDLDLEPAWNCADALDYWTTDRGVTSTGVTSHYADCLAFLTNTQL